MDPVESLNTFKCGRWGRREGWVRSKTSVKLRRSHRQRLRAAAGSGEGEETALSPEPSDERQPCPHLDVSPAIPTLHADRPAGKTMKVGHVKHQVRGATLQQQ